MAPRVLKVPLGRRARKVLRVQQELPARLELKDPQARKELPELQARKDPQVPPALRRRFPISPPAT